MGDRAAGRSVSEFSRGLSSSEELRRRLVLVARPLLMLGSSFAAAHGCRRVRCNMAPESISRGGRHILYIQIESRRSTEGHCVICHSGWAEDNLPAIVTITVGIRALRGGCRTCSIPASYGIRKAVQVHLHPAPSAVTVTGMLNPVTAGAIRNSF